MHYLIEAAAYRPIRSGSCSRIYFSGEKVIKALPLESGNNSIKYRNESRAYLKLKNFTFSPKLELEVCSNNMGYFVMPLIKGIFLNHIYLSEGKISFSDQSMKAVVLSKIILALMEMLSVQLYWNDLSAHNIIISEGEVFFIDFGESSERELHDHISMLTWIMYDLQIGQALSYKSGIYSKIHEVGIDKKKSFNNRFFANKNFFSSEMLWIYNYISSLTEIDELKYMPTSISSQLKELARHKILINFS